MHGTGWHLRLRLRLVRLVLLLGGVAAAAGCAAVVLMLMRAGAATGAVHGLDMFPAHFKRKGCDGQLQEVTGHQLRGQQHALDLRGLRCKLAAASLSYSADGAGKDTHGPVCLLQQILHATGHNIHGQILNQCVQGP